MSRYDDFNEDEFIDALINDVPYVIIKNGNMEWQTTPHFLRRCINIQNSEAVTYIGPGGVINVPAGSWLTITDVTFLLNPPISEPGHHPGINRPNKPWEDSENE